MRAVLISELSGPNAVMVHEVARPDPGPDDVLIRVRSAGVSFPEVLQSRGKYQLQPDLPFVPGSEVGGEVVVAPEGSALRPGDRVAAFTMLAGLAEYVTASSECTFAIPDDMSFDQAAAFPLNYLTAHVALTRRGRLAPGETVLVQGAAGGLGTAAIQVAKAFGSGSVIAVVSSDAKADIARAAGADHCVAVEGFRSAVEALGGVDIVVDPVGGDRFTDSLRCLRTDGRLLVIGFTGGEIPTVRVNRLLLKNIDLVGVAWGGYARPRPGFIASQWAEMLPHIKSGVIRPIVGAAYPLDKVHEALTAIDSRSAVGKLVANP